MRIALLLGLLAYSCQGSHRSQAEDDAALIQRTSEYHSSHSAHRVGLRAKEDEADVSDCGGVGEGELASTGSDEWGDTWGVEAGGSEADADADLLEDTEAKLPRDPSKLEAHFQSRMKAVGAAPVDATATRDMKVLFAVMSHWKGHRIRDGLRHSWMQHPQVCPASVGDDEAHPECAVFVTFCVGRSDGPLGKLPKDHEALKTDGVTLPIWENMNHGKTIVWFMYALEAFPWATHIGKMDEDVFPVFGVLLPGIAKVKVSPGCEAFLGEPVKFNLKSGCNKALMSLGIVPDYPEESCAFHMNGGLYLGTRGLWKRLTANGTFWPKYPDWGGEDCNTGLAVNEYVRLHGLCVNTWQMQPSGAWEHWKGWKPRPMMVSKNGGIAIGRTCRRNGGYRIGVWTARNGTALNASWHAIGSWKPDRTEPAEYPQDLEGWRRWTAATANYEDVVLNGTAYAKQLVNESYAKLLLQRMKEKKEWQEEKLRNRERARERQEEKKMRHRKLRQLRCLERRRRAQAP